MVSDTVGDFIIRLKNAGMAGRTEVAVPYSGLRRAIAEKLQHIGYLDSVSEATKGSIKNLVVTLKLVGGKSAINGVQRVSKPGRRLYTKVKDIHPVKFGRGHLMLSTPAGILTDAEAREKNMGGEQLFIIW